MSKAMKTAIAAVTAVALMSSTASAVPIGNGLSLSKAAQTNVETVRWRGHGGRGGGWGGAAAGFAAGAIIGGIIASQQGYGYGYGPGPYYGPAYGPGYYPAPVYGGGDPEGYCMSRFRSYDPASGTYMGFDGMRHPCP